MSASKIKLNFVFYFEESLIRWQEKFGENHEFKLVKRKWFGTPKVTAIMKSADFLHKNFKRNAKNFRFIFVDNYAKYY